MATRVNDRPPRWTIHPNPPREDYAVNWEQYKGEDVFKVAVIGDSHMAKTAFFLPPWLPVCKNRLYEIKDYSAPGATAKNQHYINMTNLLEWKPHVTILFIGANDLDSKELFINKDPMDAVIDLYHFLAIRGHWPLVCGVPRRLAPRHITITECEKRVRRANYTLKRKLAVDYGDRFIDLPYMFFEDDFISEDGVHYQGCAYELAAKAIMQALWDMSEKDSMQLTNPVKKPDNILWKDCDGVWMTMEWKPHSFTYHVSQLHCKK